MAAIISSARPGRAGRSTSAASGGTAANVVREAGVAICHEATANAVPNLAVGAMRRPMAAGRTQGMSALHRWFNLAGVLLPFVGFVVAVVLLWNTLVDWSDLAVMLIMYVISGYGVTLGFHRLLTHRSFQTFKPVEYTFADPRLAGRPGPGDVVGGRPPQAPRAHRPGGRPALAARARRRVGRARRPLVRAHGLAVRRLRHRRALPLRARPLRGPRHAGHPPHASASGCSSACCCRSGSAT